MTGVLPPGRSASRKRPSIQKTLALLAKNRHYYLLLLPPIAYFVVFHYIPIYGITLAFKDFRFSDGILRSPCVGFKHIARLFQSPTN